MENVITTSSISRQSYNTTLSENVYINFLIPKVNNSIYFPIELCIVQCILKCVELNAYHTVKLTNNHSAGNTHKNTN